MATRTSDRHVTARNTILFWLAIVIAIAGISIIVVYTQIRDESPANHTVTTSLPAQQSGNQDPVTDSQDATARAHAAAVAAAGADPDE